MPATFRDWLDVATERGKDVSALKGESRWVAALYMAGYMVECRLKALLSRKGQPFPTRGRTGHDLKALSEAAGFRLSDFGGLKRMFIEFWSTDLRYNTSMSPDSDFESLFQGARELSTYLQRRIRT